MKNTENNHSLHDQLENLKCIRCAFESLHLKKPFVEKAKATKQILYYAGLVDKFENENEIFRQYFTFKTRRWFVLEKDE